MLVLVIIAIAVLATAIAAFVLASRYYVSAFARATRNDWSAVVRDSHLRAVYRTSRGIQRSSRKAFGAVDRGKGPAYRLLFDLAVPDAGGGAALLDVALVAPSGVLGVIVLDGAGSLHGGADDESWLAVTGSDDQMSERLFPNAARTVAAARDALFTYLSEEGAAADEPFSVPIRLAVVHSKKLDVSDASFGVDVPCVCLREAGALVEPAGMGSSEASVVLDARAMQSICRVLRVCSNAHAGLSEEERVEGRHLPGIDFLKESHAADWARRALRDSRPQTVGGELVRQADRLIADKESFDALTWDRITEIGEDLATERNPERIAQLSAELRLIARTNEALNYRFGIAQAPENAPLSGAGLVVDSSVRVLEPSQPDEQLAQALEQAESHGFFDKKPVAE